MDIINNIENVLGRIETACKNCGRDPQEVRLLMATKTVSADRIKMALSTGQTLIAENKIQEVKEKFLALESTPHESHFIGHLQTNKVKDVLRYDISCIQSMDRMKLARKLHHRLEYKNKEIDVLVQVNTSGEESKFGVEPEEAIELVKGIALLPRIHIRGLMTIGLFSSETEKVRQCFKILKNLSHEIDAEGIEGVEMKELSMGMSGDFETAIEEGATIVRVGTAIFGKRKYPDSFYWNEKKSLR